MTKLLALSGWSEESKHSMEIPVKTEFSNLLNPTAGKQRLLLNHLTMTEVILSKPGEREYHVVHGIMG
jgi:hypothetical protein